MKKKLLILAPLLMIVLVTIFTFFSTMFSSDTLLKANIAALADDTACGWLDKPKCYETISSSPIEGVEAFSVKFCLTSGLCSENVKVYSASDESTCWL